MSSKRITIMLDDDLVAKLRKLQSEMIKNSENSVSFSRVLNQVVREAMKK